VTAGGPPRLRCRANGGCPPPRQIYEARATIEVALAELAAPAKKERAQQILAQALE